MMMNETMKHYRVTVQALSPIYVGSGMKLNPREYIYLPKEKRVIVPKLEIMLSEIAKRYEQDYINFMMKQQGYDLRHWLEQHRYTRADMARWADYSMDVGDVFAGRPKSREINCFMKDGLGRPYVPGSSLKGAIRTALLVYTMAKKPNDFKKIKSEISNKINSNERNIEREQGTLEEQVFHTLERDKENRRSIVNDSLAGLLVSDSSFIDLKQLTLVQKIDVDVKGEEHALPIFREALMPGTKLTFELTIRMPDGFGGVETIRRAIAYYQRECYERFYIRFHRGEDREDQIWLGGGCGYVSKTVLYPVFGDGSALKLVDCVFRKTLGKRYQEHKHNRDVKEYRIAPHMCKCTRHGGRLYDMGRGKIMIEEV